MNMKNAFTVICLLITLCCITSARAQKAYDFIKYQGTIDGNKTTLQLADGYLLASKLTIYSKFEDQVFSPLTDEPDIRGDWRFDAVKLTGSHKNNGGTWLILKGLNKPEYPSQIMAIYRDGKVQKKVFFKRRN
jgi:hypothetical protein